MSILQDFEKIRDEIGHKKYDMIEEYLNEKCPKKQIKKYESELSKIKEKNKLMKRYNIIFLDDVLYKKEEWDKFENWYNEHNRKIEITDTWLLDDYDCLFCKANLFVNDKIVANIITCYDENDLRYSIGNQNSDMNKKFVNKALNKLILLNFDKFINLPKISKCSKLLQSIYDSVCSSEASMCHITKEDWEEEYKDDFSDEDINILKKEVKKLKLDDVITFNDGEYMIVGYENLEMCFNDDRSFDNEKESSEIEL